MSTEVRVLGATALLTAALVFLAWWLGQHRVEVAQQVHDVETVSLVELPALSRSEPPRALPAMPPDAGFASAFDAGVAMEGTEEELAAILIPAICNQRRNDCRCEEYPSRFAAEEERVGATTCEQDTLRDYRIWWRNNIHGPVVVVPEPELSLSLNQRVRCEGFDGYISDFLRADAVAGERCASVYECADGSTCFDDRCVRYQQLGEPCLTESQARRQQLPGSSVFCDGNLVCSDGTCRMPEVAERARCPLGEFERYVGGELECIRAGARCETGGDCGSGQCVGATGWELRCVPPGAAFFDNLSRDCGSALCPLGDVCVHNPYGESRCMHVVEEGADCSEAVCGEGLHCEVVVPSDGHCIAHSCLTTRTFGDVAIE